MKIITVELDNLSKNVLPYDSRGLQILTINHFRFRKFISMHMNSNPSSNLDGIPSVM